MTQANVLQQDIKPSNLAAALPPQTTSFSLRPLFHILPSSIPTMGTCTARAASRFILQTGV